MPNGGVPLHLVLEPTTTTTIVHCKGAELFAYDRAEWERAGVNAEPLLALREAESMVLERFLRYWLNDNDEGLLYRPRGVRVSYDF